MEDCYAESQLFTLVASALRTGNDQEQHISMESLIRICDALDCELKDVVELVKTEE